MFASVTFNFETRDEFEATMKAIVGTRAMANGAKADLAPAPVEAKAEVEPEPAQDKPRRGRPPKAESTEAPEPAKAEPEKTKKAALGDLVGAIRSFVLADKVGNMRKLIPLMPEGKKSLDALELEEAQRIVLQLGLEVD